ncbi:MAG: nucleoside triphosphate pyrophosphohydrolase [Desulfovibrionaceae bacterium]|nr:nucleoside triphosphate pyrophosphohydrolase [Desulfovibrionaceae bacterium]
MSNSALSKLNDLVKRLTAPDGCPWDREQTPESLADYIIEESHELVAAIRAGKEADILEELGDVAFLLVFIAHLYAQKGSFTLDDALDYNRAKMIRRHPHVFGDTKFDSREEQLKTWEQIKRAEHTNQDGQAQGIFASLPSSLPALVKAYRLNSKAARVDFTFSDDEACEQQVEAEWLEWLDACQNGTQEEQKHELGDLVFTLAELGRRKGIKINEATELANIRFLKRFEQMEAYAREEQRDFSALSRQEKEVLWERAKTDTQSQTSN